MAPSSWILYAQLIQTKKVTNFKPLSLLSLFLNFPFLLSSSTLTNVLRRGMSNWFAAKKLVDLHYGEILQVCITDKQRLCHHSGLVLKRKHFCDSGFLSLSPYIAASPRVVVTVFKTSSTWQEQLNMKVMVSRGTLCKKEKWDKTIKHCVYLETIIQGFFTLALAFLLLSQVKVAK